MKLTKLLLPLPGLLLLAFSCQETDRVEAKKQELSKAKTELFELKARVAELEKELAAMGAIEADPNLTLVSTFTVRRQPFVHKVDVRGTVRSRNNVLISAETPAAVQQVLVVEGQQVKRGQVLIIQDGEILRKTIKELEASLNLATTIYERQQKLWAQNIGTEVQYLEAKNKKEALELKLSTTRSQLSKTRIKAPFDGIVDMIDTRVGEMIQPGVPVVRIVSMSNMYIKADVSESFIGKFRKGQPVKVYFPSTGKTLNSTIAAIGQVINPNNRTFEIDVSLPNHYQVKPFMIAVLTLADYENKNAYVVPTRIIQSDRMGNFVYRVVDRDSTTVVQRVDISVGITYGNQTEITSGLHEGEVLVLKGGIELTNGAAVKVVEE